MKPVIKYASSDDKRFADYIVDFFKNRNQGELKDAFLEMKVRDYECLKDELAHILANGGHPPNWVPHEDEN